MKPPDPQPSTVAILCAAAAVLCGCLMPTGCALNGNRVALESQLREREATIRDLQTEVAETERLLADQDREIQVLRNTAVQKPLNRGGVSTVSSSVETRTAWGSVTSLRIHRLTSGIVRDEDGQPTQVNVVVQPLDQDGELVKVAGGLQVTVSQVTADGEPVRLISRKFTMTESRSLWTRGLVSSGFHIQLPLPVADGVSDDATTRKLLISTTLTLNSERSYSTSELITVEL
ncbi:MAG: hypothetical protein RIK87_26900 [Fuerstiella sp.]